MKTTAAVPFPPANLVAALLVAAACSQPSTSSEEATRPGVPAGPAPAALAPAPAPTADAADDDDLPTEKFSGGAKAFAEVRDALLKSYYADGITEDDVYRAATAGMLEKIEPRMKKYNRLLSPRELAEIKNDMRGEVVGVGVRIAFDEKSGYADVLGTIAGSPSEKAGLLAGDKIVTVDGKLYKGMRMKDVVADIRGKLGEPVTLRVLREGKLLDVTVVRARVPFDTPTWSILPDALGYLRIPSFTDRTPAAVRSGLEELSNGGVRALVVDLRQSPGGSFERAIETAELLVPAGAPIVVLKRRGKPEEKHVSKGTPILGDVPLAVLVDGGTSSGAEFLAAALKETRRARLVGGRTHGKWSVQSLDELPNGYAYKYTVSLFQTPAGKTYEGVGVAPDVEASMEEGDLARIQAVKPEARLGVDPPLRTAKELLVRP